MEFALDQVVAQTRDNPVFYVQYAHARCRSVLRAAAEMFGAEETSDTALAAVSLGGLGAEPELAVVRRLAQWPRVVQAAALAREPHRIAFFLYDLAADFHMLWNRGRDDTTLRFLQQDRPVETLARLALVAATAVVIRSGLAVMGVLEWIVIFAFVALSAAHTTEPGAAHSSGAHAAPQGSHG